MGFLFLRFASAKSIRLQRERDVSLLGSPQRLVGAERLAWYWSTFSAIPLPPSASPRCSPAAPAASPAQSNAPEWRNAGVGGAAEQPLFLPRATRSSLPNERRRAGSNNLSLKNCFPEDSRMQEPGESTLPVGGIEKSSATFVRREVAELGKHDAAIQKNSQRERNSLRKLPEIQDRSTTHQAVLSPLILWLNTYVRCTLYFDTSFDTSFKFGEEVVGH